jgi:hypothetical protein
LKAATVIALPVVSAAAARTEYASSLRSIVDGRFGILAADVVDLVVVFWVTQVDFARMTGPR